MSNHTLTAKLPQIEADFSTLVISRKFAWAVFLLTFGLMLSDVMSRQVLNAVFPVIKLEWALSDTQLGSLNSIVALMVGLLALPLSIVADRWGRVRAVLAMAVWWSLATLWCGLATSYHEMLAARFFVGVGEAAFGSVGIAILIRVFPEHQRATLVATIMGGAALGAVLGMLLGGVIATQLSWRYAFHAMALFGLVLAFVYFLVVTEARLSGKAAVHSTDEVRANLTLGELFRNILGKRSLWFAYGGSAFQLFILSTLMAWLPSYLNREYAFALDKAGAVAAGFLLLTAIGAALCGNVCDRLSRDAPQRKWTLAIVFAAFSSAMLFAAFQLPDGPVQLSVLALGVFVVQGACGPIGAIIAKLVPAPSHASAYGLMSTINNLLGIAIGPFLTGIVADVIGLTGALKLVPLVGLLPVFLLFLGSHFYREDLRSVEHS